MKIPYAQMFRYAVIELGLAPESFWQLTISEWLLLTAVPAQTPAPSRAEVSKCAAIWQELQKDIK